MLKAEKMPLPETALVSPKSDFAPSDPGLPRTDHMTRIAALRFPGPVRVSLRHDVLILQAAKSMPKPRQARAAPTFSRPAQPSHRVAFPYKRAVPAGSRARLRSNPTLPGWPGESAIISRDNPGGRFQPEVPASESAGKSPLPEKLKARGPGVVRDSPGSGLAAPAERRRDRASAIPSRSSPAGQVGRSAPAAASPPSPRCLARGDGRRPTTGRRGRKA